MVLSHGLLWFDLAFLGRARAIAAAVVHGASGVALVDPGPTTCLPTLEAQLLAHGITLHDVRHILLTHIHLDHAGAVGTIVRSHPHVRVAVHARGVVHLADPRRLLESATRLYGADMERLWGEVAAVPPENLVTLNGGEHFPAGGRVFDVAYTPGHARHHVSFLDPASGVAFVGDVAGVSVDGGYVLPPTPPPDIDLDAWRDSVARIQAWSPDTLFLTHFGPAAPVGPHLQALVENLELMASWVANTLRMSGTDQERAAHFEATLGHHLRERMTETQMASYPVVAPFDQLWLGLARYWRTTSPALYG